jgi:ice-binding like protein/Big-like domain-containing protein
MISKSFLSTSGSACLLLAFATACNDAATVPGVYDGVGGAAGSAGAGARGGAAGAAGAGGAASGNGGSGNGGSGNGGSASGSGGSANGSGGSAGSSPEETDGGVPDAGDAGEDASPPLVTIPTVTSNSPPDEATDIALNRRVRATFSEPMDPDTLDTTSFTLTSLATDAGGPVEGTVIATGSSVVFEPDAPLAAETEFVATITTAATDAEGTALAAEHTWSFTTGELLIPGDPVDLGTAGDYVILAKSAISTVPPSAILGDVGISPAAASFITGFSLTADGTNVFSTSPQVTGQLFAANYTSPTPANLTAAVSDMELAFTDAAGRAPGTSGLGTGSIGGLSLPAGVYSWGTGVSIASDLTLDGDATAVWIFQVAQNLTVSNAVDITLSGGALPQNVFWQVSGAVTIGTTSHFEGVILSQTAITLGTGASIDGRLLAQTAVVLDTNAVTEPSE